MDKAAIYLPVSLTHLSPSLRASMIRSRQIGSNLPPTCDLLFPFTPRPIRLSCPPGSGCDLLKSVPVSWARMRKERDWVVPVRGCQSSVSSISLFLLRSLGIKQGTFSTLRPCLHTQAAAAGANSRHG